MFSDSLVEITGFAVTPKEIKYKNETGCQTKPQLLTEKGSQTTLTQDFSNQKDITSEFRETPEYDSERLASFLNRIYPDLIEELEKNDGAGNLNTYDAGNDDQVVGLHNIESENFQGKVVSCLSWNSTGMSLAISLCEPFHESWCTHDGQIYVYNTNKSEFSISPPSYILNTASCPQCISFHPLKPSLLIGGFHNGEIMVWDLTEDDAFPVGGSPNDQVPRHSDVITSITWLFDGIYFATSGKDGMIIFWKIFMKKIEPHKKFFISSEYFNPGRSIINNHTEILSLDFWKDPKESDFIVAGGGNIFHCSSEFIENIPMKPGFSDPVLMKYAPHSGIITSVRCSSNDLFATCGTDSEIHVYSSREKSPLHVIHSEFPLFGIEWIGNVSKIIACWGSAPNVHFYKTSTKERLDMFTIKIKNRDAEIVETKLNKQRRGVVAIGTNKGDTSIWTIPNILFS